MEDEKGNAAANKAQRLISHALVSGKQAEKTDLRPLLSDLLQQAVPVPRSRPCIQDSVTLFARLCRWLRSIAPGLAAQLGGNLGKLPRPQALSPERRGEVFVGKAVVFSLVFKEKLKSYLPGTKGPGTRRITLRLVTQNHPEMERRKVAKPALGKSFIVAPANGYIPYVILS